MAGATPPTEEEWLAEERGSAASLALPDGRRVDLSPAVAAVLSAGVMVAADVTIGPAPALNEEIESLAAELRERHGGKQPGEIRELAEARRLYRAVGVDPTRTRPSSEALLRRVLRSQPLYRLGNAIDACNLASLSFLLPIGLYDLDRVEGDVLLRLGRPGESYEGIRKGPVHLEGRLGLFDRRGPFGSPTSDSARTSVDESTHGLLAVIMATAAYPAEAMARHLELLASLTTRHCGGSCALAGHLAAGEGAA
jgi:DNA/RNA-binding domain of Phe-tRNA-synthetase-like protein